MTLSDHSATGCPPVAVAAIGGADPRLVGGVLCGAIVADGLTWASAHDRAIVDAYRTVGPSVTAIAAHCRAMDPGYPWPDAILWAIEAYDAAATAAAERAATMATLRAVADRLHATIADAEDALDRLDAARAAVRVAGHDVDRVLDVIRGAAHDGR